MLYMTDWEDKKKVVELCAFAWPFKKATNLWTQGVNWTPKGVTGDGRCGTRCGQGRMDPLTQKFRHYMALAVDPHRGPRGEGATRMTCGMPDQLIKEILAALQQTQNIRSKVVLDLCAGFQSIKQAVMDAGAHYVAVDICGNRKKRMEKPRRGAVVLRCNNKILVTIQHNQHKRAVKTILATEQTNADVTPHSAGVRAMREGLGILPEDYDNLITKGPKAVALNNTTYYVYDLHQCIPQAVIEECHQKAAVRMGDGGTTGWVWEDIRKPISGLWREEDAKLKSVLDEEKPLAGDNSGGRPGGC